jgi:hypothetical protein
MVRVQIQLESDEHRALKKRAKRLGVSVAELVRRAVGAELRAAEPPNRHQTVRRALNVIGAHADPDGAADIARDHDRVLADAYRS